MAITFPSSPSTGQVFTVGNRSWAWDGSAWKGGVSSTGDAGTLDNLDSLQFLRSDADDSITGQIIFPSTNANKPVFPQGLLARADQSDTTGFHDIWGISERYYPSNSTSGDAWGIRWSGTPNEIQFIGSGSEKFKVDLDTGAATATSFIGDGSNLTGLPAGYTDADVISHLNSKSLYFNGGKIGIGTASPFSKLQVSGHTFSGGNGMYTDSRVGISNHGNLTGMMLASTYDNGTYPEYGLVFVQGPSTSTYNVWSISPDGPTKGDGLNFIYGSNATNIHTATPKVTFDGNGNVGIGTVSPERPLHVKGEIYVNHNADNAGVKTSFRSLHVSNNTIEIQQFGQSHSSSPAVNQIAVSNAEQHLHLVTDSTANVDAGTSTKGIFLRSGGNVGIGTQSPDRKLDVRGSVRFSVNSTTHETFVFTTQAADDAKLIMKNASSADNIILRANGYSYFNGGNVGIGVTSPSEKLHIASGNIRVDTSSSSSFKIENAGTNAIGLYAASGDELYIGGNNSYALRFLNNGSNNVVFDNGSNVGIGTPSPTAKLQVEGDQTSNPVARIKGTGVSDNPVLSIETNNNSRDPHLRLVRPNGTSGASMVIRGGSGTDWLSIHHLARGADDQLVIRSNGNVGIGTNSPSQKFHVIGNILASGNVTANSDISLKDNIVAIPDALDKVLQIRGVTYNRNDIDDNPRQAGVIAQEVEKVLPEVVSEDANGIKSVAYGNMIGLLIEAIKEQQERIEKLEERLNANNN
jgi:ribosomal protein L27